ncbi:hypothetical protein MRX96_044048 [Rhipicephalus microplus]
MFDTAERDSTKFAFTDFVLLLYYRVTMTSKKPCGMPPSRRFIFRLRVAKEAYNNEIILKTTVVDVAPISCNIQARRLLQRIQRAISKDCCRNTLTPPSISVSAKAGFGSISKVRLNYGRWIKKA